MAELPFSSRRRRRVRGVGKITNVDIVAQTRPVRRRVILAKDLESEARPSRFKRTRDDVNLGRVVFAKLAVGIRARGVEIAEADRPESICTLEMREGMLNGKFGCPYELMVAVGCVSRNGVLPGSP